MNDIFRNFIILVFLVVSFCFEADAKENCNFLVKIDNDLCLVDSDGNPINRLTHDETHKSVAVFSPDGKYIAYAQDPFSNFDEKAIFIVDTSGQKLSKIIVEPKTDEPYLYLQQIRWVSRLVWEKPNILWSDSNVGKNGGFIDIWKLDSNLHGSREKRIGVLGGDCEFSPGKQYVACIFGTFENEKFQSFLKIYDTRKKKFSDDEFFSDDDPITIDLKQIERVDNIRFTPDSANIIITGVDKKYKLNMKTKKLSVIKELPAGIKTKTIPQRIKVKKDEKEYDAEVFDMFCGQTTNAPK